MEKAEVLTDFIDYVIEEAKADGNYTPQDKVQLALGVMQFSATVEQIFANADVQAARRIIMQQQTEARQREMAPAPPGWQPTTSNGAMGTPTTTEVPNVQN
jgi:hypothetical protein